MICHGHRWHGRGEVGVVDSRSLPDSYRPSPNDTARILPFLSLFDRGCVSPVARYNPFLRMEFKGFPALPLCCLIIRRSGVRVASPVLTNKPTRSCIKLQFPTPCITSLASAYAAQSHRLSGP